MVSVWSVAGATRLQNILGESTLLLVEKWSHLIRDDVYHVRETNLVCTGTVMSDIAEGVL